MSVAYISQDLITAYKYIDGKLVSSIVVYFLYKFSTAHPSAWFFQSCFSFNSLLYLNAFLLLSWDMFNIYILVQVSLMCVFVVVFGIAMLILSTNCWRPVVCSFDNNITFGCVFGCVVMYCYLICKVQAIDILNYLFWIPDSSSWFRSFCTIH